MRCIYSTLRPPVEQKSYADWIVNCNQKAVSYHVYVADLNTPYQPYLLVESEHKFTILEWDPSGTKLLTCDSHGCVTIYTSREFLISDWKPHFKRQFSAETFLTACWYHPGIVNFINVANQNLKTSSNHLEYTDKIQPSKFSASLRLFGGKAAEGCLLLSQTGLVCCLTLMADGTVDVVSESLNPLRVRLHIADIGYHKDGYFIVGTSSGSINSTISFYKVSLSVKSLTFDDVDAYSTSNGGDSKRVQVSSKQYHSFHLNVMSQLMNERENATCAFEQVSQIKFVSKDCPNDVLIEVNGQNLSLIELWELEIKKRNPVHSAIAALKGHSPTKPTTGNIDVKQEDGSTNSGPQQRQQSDRGSDINNHLQQQQQTTKEWSFKGNYITDKELIAIEVPRHGIFGTNRQLNIILLAYKDNSVCCLRKEDLQPISEPIMISTDRKALGRMGGHHPRSDAQDSKPFNKPYNNNSHVSLNRNISQANGTGLSGGSHHLQKPKQTTNHITDLRMSTNQTVFVAVDSTSQLHVVQLPPLISCQDTKDEETYLQYMLECCLVTGNDWWDVMVCVRRDSIETLCDKFHDAYERQPKDIQRKYFNRQLMIRASLYRCLNDPVSLCKSSDCHTMIMLNSIASILKSMLRSQDQVSPSEQLSSFLKTHAHQPALFNINNVLSKITEKEFYVETQLIQCLQPLNQWVVDFAIYLVASLPQRAKSQLPRPQHLPGAGLSKSKEALETLRELLIIIKIWGKQNVASLPVVFKLNDQIDVIGSLFRLISMLYTTISNSGEPDESLLDECSQLANNITITQFEYFLSAIGVASPSLHQDVGQQQLVPGSAASKDATPRIVMEYFQEHHTPELVQLDKIEGSINLNGSRKIDVVRNISLGAHPLMNVRYCTRCCAVSMRPLFNNTRVWEQRWMITCACGGHWAQSNGMFSNKKSSLAVLYNSSNFSGLNQQAAGQLVR